MINPSEEHRIPRGAGGRTAALKVGVNFEDDAVVGGCVVPPWTEITGGEKGGT